MLSPSLFLDYRHLVEYILYVQSVPTSQRHKLVSLWNPARHFKWGPFYRLQRASRALGVQVEDLFLLVFDRDAISTDEPLLVLKHLIRNSYRHLFLQRSMQRRLDCSGPAYPVDVELPSKLFLSTHQPLLRQIIRYFLAGALDRAQRL